MELAITVSADKTKKGVEISADTFGREFNEALVHQVVNAYIAERSVTKAQKTRSQVRGGGIKPWRQKGTGRARAGTIRSPIWRTGGVTFAASPREVSHKVNKKMYRGAMRSIFSELIRQNRLVLVESLAIDTPKTKLFVNKLKDLGVESGLILLGDWDQSLYLAARNVPKIQLKLAASVDPVSLLKHDKVVMTVDALKKIEEALQ